MSNIKQLGIPKTIGELKEMIKDYPDNTSFEFRNQPRQELIEVNESVCFHEVCVSYGRDIVLNPFNNEFQNK